MTGPVNIKAERLRRGLSQAGLAEAIGISVDVVRSAEDGRRPLPGNAVAIATFFGVDVLDQWPIKSRDDDRQEAAA